MAGQRLRRYESSHAQIRSIAAQFQVVDHGLDQRKRPAQYLSGLTGGPGPALRSFIRLTRRVSIVAGEPLVVAVE